MRYGRATYEAKETDMEVAFGMDQNHIALDLELLVSRVDLLDFHLVREMCHPPMDALSCDVM